MNDEHDTNDAFLSPIEAYALRAKLRKAEKRIAELESRLAVKRKSVKSARKTIKRLHARISKIEYHLGEFAAIATECDEVYDSPDNKVLFSYAFDGVYEITFTVKLFRDAYKIVYGRECPRGWRAEQDDEVTE